MDREDLERRMAKTNSAYEVLKKNIEEEDADEEAFEEASGQHASAGADAVDGAQEDRDI